MGEVTKTLKTLWIPLELIFVFNSEFPSKLLALSQGYIQDLDRFDIAMAMLAVSVALLVIIFLWRRRHRLRFRKQEYIFSNAEHRFFNHLIEAVGDDYLVFGKVRIADVLTPDDRLSRKTWWRAFTTISSKHLDFVLCRRDASIVCAIELDDRSHDKPERLARDAFVDAACAQAGLPLIRFTVRRRYNVADIRRALYELTEDASLS